MIGARPEPIRAEMDPVGYLETSMSVGQVTTIPIAELPNADLLVIVSYTGGPFRFRVDGQAPGPTSGWAAEDGDTDDLNRYEAQKWAACLAQGALAGTVRIGIYRRRR